METDIFAGLNKIIKGVGSVIGEGVNVYKDIAGINTDQTTQKITEKTTAGTVTAGISGNTAMILIGVIVASAVLTKLIRG